MDIVRRLKKKGYRLTKPRKEIINVLGNTPLSAQEIHTLLKKKHIHVDLVSVYRSLELFVNMGIVYEIDLGEDKKRYELTDKDTHHHHLVCNNCGTIEDVTIDEAAFLQKIKTKTGFKIDHHHLEFFGLCAHCQ